MRKRILLTFLLFILIPLNINAEQLNHSQSISAVETSIFGYDYNDESVSKRLERIEMNLYGKKKSGNIQKRIDDIKNDIGFVEYKQPDKPQNKTESPFNTSDSMKKSMIPEDSSVEYPMVDKLEQEIFNTTYKNENIYKRLDRLEVKVYGKTSTDSLNNRVDKLASVIKPNVKRTYRQNDYISPQQMENYYASSGLEPVNDQSLPFQLAALEQDLLNHDYMNENVSNRLGRLEQKLFKRTFSTDSDITRLQRIMVAYDAKKNSYKYENNRKMQNMATMSQIGGILLMILAILL